MIKKLHIQDFRGFEELKLEGLNRLNLIVGRNNSGKTSLLEALAILEGASFGSMPKLLRRELGNVGTRYFRWLPRDRSSEQLSILYAGHAHNYHAEVRIARSQVSGPEADEWTQLNVSPPLYIRSATGGSASELSFDPHWRESPNEPNFRVVSTDLADPHRLLLSFAKAVRPSDGEALLHDMLRAVDSRVSRIRVEPGEGSEGNKIMVDVGLSESMPLSQVGHGMSRLVAMLSELIGDRPSVCLIDEVENGIHHSALPDIWKGLAEVCERLDIQLFATTHSHECIEAAHEAMSARDNYDFSVIQLVRASDGIKGYVRDQKDIQAALAGEIDLR